MFKKFFISLPFLGGQWHCAGVGAAVKFRVRLRLYWKWLALQHWFQGHYTSLNTNTETSPQRRRTIITNTLQVTTLNLEKWLKVLILYVKKDTVLVYTVTKDTVLVYAVTKDIAYCSARSRTKEGHCTCTSTWRKSNPFVVPVFTYPIGSCAMYGYTLYEYTVQLINRTKSYSLKKVQQRQAPV